MGMKLPKLTAIIERSRKHYIVACPELDVVTQGKTLKEAKRNIQEAVELFLEYATVKEIKRRACIY